MNEDVRASAYAEEGAIKQMGVMERASILARSNVIEDEKVRFQFNVSENKMLEYSRIS